MRSIDKTHISSILSELGNIKLVAATKYFDIEEMTLLSKAGIKCFGENKVQDIIAKYDHFKNIEWHMIGTLQTNKVKYIIDKVALIHSVDSFSLLKEINKQALKHNKVMDILIQVNIANEQSKHGFGVNEVDNVLYVAMGYQNVNVLGFMIMAPHIDPEETRVYFKQAKSLLDKYNLSTLSMGMSNDYKVAIEEGSTVVRIGSKLFNEKEE